MNFRKWSVGFEPKIATFFKEYEEKKFKIYLSDQNKSKSTIKEYAKFIRLIIREAKNYPSI